MRRSAIAASISAAILASGFVLLAAGAGCGKQIPIGTFEGRRNEPGRPGADPVVVAQLNRVILRIAADGKANLEDGGIPWEGHVTREGEKLTFDVDAISGIGMAKQPGDLPRRIEFAIVSDGELTFGSVRLIRSLD